MYYTTKFRFLAKPNCKPNLKFSKKARTKTRYETHKTGNHLDFRIVFTPSFEHETPNLMYNLVSLEKKIGAIVSWVLNPPTPVPPTPVVVRQFANYTCTGQAPYSISCDDDLNPKNGSRADTVCLKNRLTNNQKTWALHFVAHNARVLGCLLPATFISLYLSVNYFSFQKLYFRSWFSSIGKSGQESRCE